MDGFDYGLSECVVEYEWKIAVFRARLDVMQRIGSRENGGFMADLRFSVVTVTFNAENCLRRTVESVLKQTYAPFEYLIFDGLSKDGTVAVAEEYRSALEARGIRYRVVSEKDSGIYDAMNKGVRAAEGDFVSFLNAGDWYEPTSLADVNAFYQEAPFELTYGGLNYIMPDGKVRVKMSRLDRFPVSSRHWNHPSMFLTRELYRKFGFDERYRMYADFDLYLRLRRAGVKIRVIDKVITNFMADGISTDVAWKKVLARAGEKYRSYRENGYGRFYFLESYGWEILKMLYFRLRG